MLDAVFPVRPEESMIVGHRSTALINDLRMVDDLHIYNRVTSDLVRIGTALAVGHTMVTDCLIITDREGRVFVLHLLYRQVQTIVRHNTLILLYAGELTTLTRCDGMPSERQLVRTDNSRGVNRIDVVNSQLQNLHGVATKAVRRVVIVRTGLLISHVMPGVFVTLIHRLHIPYRIRINHTQRHMNHTVATAHMVRVRVLTTLTQGLVTKRDTASLTDRLLQIRIRDELNLQVQDILNTILRSRGMIFDDIDVTS